MELKLQLNEKILVRVALAILALGILILGHLTLSYRSQLALTQDVVTTHEANFVELDKNFAAAVIQVVSKAIEESRAQQEATQ